MSRNEPLPSPLPSDGYSENADVSLAEVLDALSVLRDDMREAIHSRGDLAAIHADYLPGAINLLHYLALRRQDIRQLQKQLSALGLSSLGRCEADALGSVERVIDVLKTLDASQEPSAPSAGSPLANSLQTNPLLDHGAALFGEAPQARSVRIMVTMPSEAADDYELVESLLAAGMNCQRINCAHDDAPAWLNMIKHLRKASKKLGKPCQVAMDLAGPKLRTGPVALGPAVLKVKPLRDSFGRVQLPAEVLLTGDPARLVDNSVLLPEPWLRQLKVGDRLAFRDARDAKRALVISAVEEAGCTAQLEKTAYFVPGTLFTLNEPAGRKACAKLQAVPPCAQTITVNEGDVLLLGLEGEGVAAQFDADGKPLAPARISCTSAAVLETALPGDPIWFDDGKIGGVITARRDGELDIHIHHAPDGAKLKADKGINLPDTDLKLGALSEDDLDALAFACKHADIVQLSFVNQVADVHALLEHIERLKAPDLGVVLKIETRRGFEQLPELLLAGMRRPRLGVMIARGDLAVETGFERSAELQEEMLCLCEAAHVPVIWATQVLESLAKTGAPTRAEITDAAMGVRAECVMLNKGPYILKAIATLDDLLQRMQNHRDKKRDLLRKLNVAMLHG